MAVEISSWAELAAISSDLSGDYILTCDLDSSSAGYPSTWTPLGNSSTKFSGTFDGQNHTISDIYFTNTSSSDYGGLFGYTNGSTIQNVGVLDVNITISDDYIGGLVGYNSSYSSISNCYSTGNVTGGDDYTGGLVGYNNNYSSVSNCYSECLVVTGVGDYYTGGLVGYNNIYSSVSNCYSTGNVTGASSVGGLVGHNSSSSIHNCYSTGAPIGTTPGGLIGTYSSGTIENCYWDTDTGGISVAAGSGTPSNCTGLTTAQMKVAANFGGMNPVDIFSANILNPPYWMINEGVTYPLISIKDLNLSQVSGNVTEGENPVENAKIILIDTTNNYIENIGYTNSSGAYLIPARPGTYHILCDYFAGGERYVDSSKPNVVVPDFGA